MTLYSFFDEHGIQYWTSGKNVSRGWVNIQCVFPDCDDSSNHLGISLESGRYHCWKCGNKGFTDAIVQKISGCSWSRAKLLAEQFTLNSAGTESVEPSPATRPKPSDLLKGFSYDLSPLYRNYLEKRNFDPDYLQQKYGIMASGNTGGFKFRVIAPVRMADKVVSYIGRGITDRIVPKYKVCPDSEAKVPRRELIYNLDSIRGRGTAMIVEGMTDVWRLGDGVVAVFTTSFSMSQVAAICRAGAQKVFIIFDPERQAQEKARQFAHSLLVRFPSIERVELPGCDPGDLGDDDARALRRELGV